MANDLNRVVLVGRLTRDPELRSTNSGSYLCRFSLASNRTVFQKDAENREEVGFFDCVAWGKLAEVISKYTQKGRRVAVDGSLRYSSWENNEGKRQSKVEVFVENFQFLDSKGSYDSAGGAPAYTDSDHSQPQQQQQAPASANEGFDEPFSDDIPF